MSGAEPSHEAPAAHPPGSERSQPASAVGFLVAAAVNTLVLWVVHQLPDWDWPGWLTDEFEDLVPVLTVALGTSIVVNLVSVVLADGWLRSVGGVVTAATGFAAAVATYRVFPFDFSAHATDWSWLARAVVIIGVVGTAIGVVAETSKLVARGVRRARRA